MNPGQVCQFCAAPAKIEGTCARNPVQAVFSCKAEACRAEFRRLVSDNPHYPAAKKRRRRRPRQKTREVR